MTDEHSGGLNFNPRETETADDSVKQLLFA